jgi:hypothetical protein
MPYFVYKVFPDKSLEPVDIHDVFKEAMQQCRQMRKDIPADQNYQVRMVFAKDKTEARRLLTAKRAASPVEEWEV